VPAQQARQRQPKADHGSAPSVHHDLPALSQRSMRRHRAAVTAGSRLSRPTICSKTGSLRFLGSHGSGDGHAVTALDVGALETRGSIWRWSHDRSRRFTRDIYPAESLMRRKALLGWQPRPCQRTSRTTLRYRWDPCPDQGRSHAALDHRHAVVECSMITAAETTAESLGSFLAADYRRSFGVGEGRPRRTARSSRAPCDRMPRQQRRALSTPSSTPCW